MLAIIEGGPTAKRQGKSTNIKILSNDDCLILDEIFDLRCKIYDQQNFTSLCKVGLRAVWLFRNAGKDPETAL